MPEDLTVACSIYATMPQEDRADDDFKITTLSKEEMDETTEKMQKEHGQRIGELASLPVNAITEVTDADFAILRVKVATGIWNEDPRTEGKIVFSMYRENDRLYLQRLEDEK